MNEVLHKSATDRHAGVCLLPKLLRVQIKSGGAKPPQGVTIAVTVVC